MTRIVKVESSFRPHAIGYHVTKDGKTYRLTTQPADRAEAVDWARWLLANGFRFDAGAAQVNSSNFARLGLTPESVFDPCTNIAAGGQILTEFYRGAAARFGPGKQALLAAVSAYQSGSFTRGYETGYVDRVAGSTGGFLQVRKGEGAPGRSGGSARAAYDAPTAVAWPSSSSATKGE